MDRDAQGHSSILTSLADLTWPEKGVGVAVSEPMLLGKIGFERLQANQGSGIHHGPDLVG
jgi:hypothetical protein